MRVVYISYGSKSVHRMTAYSALSFIRLHRDRHDVHIYTDSPGDFAGLGAYVEIEALDAEVFRAWCLEEKYRDPTGEEHSYPFMPKLCIFRAQSTSFLFLDSDTVVVKPMDSTIERIDEQNSVMYETELRFGILDWHAAFISSWDGEFIEGDSLMWNSGVVGIHEAHLGIFEEAIALTKKILRVQPVLIAEQISIGHLLARKTYVHRARDYVYHYYLEKKDYQNLITGVFRETPLRDLAKLCIEDSAAAARILRLT
jgi:hypothetical protein